MILNVSIGDEKHCIEDARHVDISTTLITYWVFEDGKYVSKTIPLPKSGIKIADLSA